MHFRNQLIGIYKKWLIRIFGHFKKRMSILDQGAVIAAGKFGVGIFIPTAEVVPERSIICIFGKLSQLIEVKIRIYSKIGIDFNI